VTPNRLSQTLPTGAHSATPMRVVPDISADADPFSGMAVGETLTMPDGHTLKYVETRWGGTSLASPLFAGVRALAQQAQHGQALGFANPAIYLRYGTRALHDVTDTPLGAGHPMTWALNWYTDTADATGPILTYLATTGRNGEDLVALRGVKGYDDETGVGTPDRAYLNSYR
jgi:subtilase family serine protease